jgi:hypothetical protein
MVKYFSHPADLSIIIIIIIIIIIVTVIINYVPY